MTLTRRKPPIGLGAAPVPDPPAYLRLFGQRSRAVWRAVALVLWTLPAAAVQTILILLPGSPKRHFARIYWAGVARLLGIERRVVGIQARSAGRPVLFVSNHTSWLDIPSLGGTLLACFVAKAEVATWPVVQTIARLGRTVFVSRRASEIGRERDDMRARLQGGDNLLLFPEGTSSDGARVLPFRSAFFAVSELTQGQPPLIQPVSIVYDRLDGLAMWRAMRPVAAWYGGMDLATHFWRLAGYRRLRATIVLHQPIDPADYSSRKLLAVAVWRVVAVSAAGLRQGRPPDPTATSDSLDMTRRKSSNVDAA